MLPRIGIDFGRVLFEKHPLGIGISNDPGYLSRAICKVVFCFVFGNPKIFILRTGVNRKNTVVIIKKENPLLVSGCHLEKKVRPSVAVATRACFSSR
jgi:hypothetical protein